MFWVDFKNLIHLLCELSTSITAAPQAMTLHGILFHVEFNAWLERGKSLSGTRFFAQEHGPANLALGRALYELEAEKLVRRLPRRLSDSINNGGRKMPSADSHAAQTRQQTSASPVTKFNRNYNANADTAYQYHAIQAARRSGLTNADLTLVHRSLQEYAVLLEHFKLELAQLIAKVQLIEVGRAVNLAYLLNDGTAVRLAADVAHAAALVRLKKLRSSTRLRQPPATIVEEHKVVAAIDAASSIRPAVRTMYETLIWRLVSQSHNSVALAQGHTYQLSTVFCPKRQPGLQLDLPVNRTQPVDMCRCCSSQISRLPHLTLHYRCGDRQITITKVKITLPSLSRKPQTATVA